VKNVKIVQAGSDAAPAVIELVADLLGELGEEGDETGTLSVPELTAAWRANEKYHCAFLAYAEDDSAVGVATVSIAFALYANGNYGIINEMYVVPEFRSAGVGAFLIEAIKSYGRKRKWSRIDVTAPESARWARTKRFYESQGFTFTGPKLKLLLS
jgi:GNAT superfamily N-acetyltransferase